MEKEKGEKRYQEIAAELVKFYLFLSQYLDRVVDEKKSQQGISAEELGRFIEEARTRLLEDSHPNPVVQRKIEQEYRDIMQLCQDYSKKSSEEKEEIVKRVSETQSVLKVKYTTLSDLVALFRSL